MQWPCGGCWPRCGRPACWSPAAAAPTRSRWPRRPRSRRRRLGVPAGLVTVDHGLQAGIGGLGGRDRRAWPWARARPGARPPGRGRCAPVVRRRPPAPPATPPSPRRPVTAPCCSRTRSTTRPRPCCSGSAAAPGRGRSPACARSTVAVLRPLLGIRRETTRAACAAERLPVGRPAQRRPRFTRVRLRAEVLPGSRTPCRAASPRPWPARPSCCATTSTRSTAWPPRSPPPRPTLPVDGLAAQPRAIRTRVLRNWVGDPAHRRPAARARRPGRRLARPGSGRPALGPCGQACVWHAAPRRTDR